MLTRFQVERFRGIQSMDLDGLKTVNVFVGKNNCGKTSVLEALWFWSCVRRPDVSWVINSARELDVSGSDHLLSLFYRQDVRQPFKLTASQDDGQTLTVEARPFVSKERKIYASSGERNASLLQVRESGLNTDTSLDGLDVFSSDAEGMTDPCYRVRYDPESHSFKSMLSADRIAQMPRVKLISSRGRAAMADQDFGKVVEENRERELVEVLKAFSPNIQGIKFGGAKKTILIDEGGPTSLPLALMGDGVVRAVTLLASVVEMSGGVVLVDEIDNGIHAGALGSFWEAVVSFACRNNTQIVATTHSWESLQCLKTVLDRDETGQAQTSVFNLVRRGEDKIFVYPYEYPDFKNVIETGVDIR